MKVLDVRMSDQENLFSLRIPYGFDTEGGYFGANEALGLAFFAFKQNLPVDTNRVAGADPGGLY